MRFRERLKRLEAEIQPPAIPRGVVEIVYGDGEAIDYDEAIRRGFDNFTDPAGGITLRISLVYESEARESADDNRPRRALRGRR